MKRKIKTKCPACSCANPPVMKKVRENIGFGIKREFYKCPKCGFEFNERSFM